MAGACAARASITRTVRPLAGRTVGEGDMVLVRDAPSYAAGDMVEHDGVQLTVIEDRGDAVLFSVPASRFRTRGGDYLHVAKGNTTEIDKATIVLEELT